MSGPVASRQAAQRSEAAPAARNSPAAPPAPALEFAGNLAIQSLLRSGITRAKLTVSQPNDPDEREADRVADAAVSGAPSTLVRCKCASCAAGVPCGQCDEETPVRLKGNGAQPTPSAAAAMPALSFLGSGGRPLPRETRRGFETKLGADLSGVRIHDGPAAAQAASALNARAFTVGSDIAFAPGQFAPSTRSGQHLLAHELAHTLQPARGSSVPARRSWYDPFVDAAEWVGGKVEAGASAAWSGTKWVGGKLNSAGRWVYNTAEDKLKAAYHCAKGIGSSLFAPISLDMLAAPQNLSLAEVTGHSKPGAEDAPTGVLNTVLDVVGHPCVQMLPGAGLLLGGVKVLKGSADLLELAWDIYKNPDPYMERIRASLTGMISGAADKARSLATAIASNENVGCILRHLNPKLQYMAENWWPILKEMAWELIWPWPGVGKDFGMIWHKIKSLGSNLWDLEFNRAADDAFSILRHLNSAAGRLYGWFLIGAVLAGAILGGIGGAAAGGAGAIPGAALGAASGFAFASEVGYGLLLATLAIEGASIYKASYNLSRSDRLPKERECDCELISSSSLTIGVCGAMVLLGGLAARFAKAIIQRVGNRLFNPEILAPLERGRLVEARIAMGELIRARFRAAAIRITDRLTARGLFRGEGNFPGIDLARDAQITIRGQQGQVIADTAGLQNAMRNGESITIDIAGGDLVSVKSRGGADVAAAVEEDIAQLANFGATPRRIPSFTAGVRQARVTITNPAARTLTVAYEPGSLTTAEIANLRVTAAQNGVTLDLRAGIPPDPRLVTPIESMPDILAEIATLATEVSDTQQPGAEECKL
ncbi:eCIS core domain-containing protein [Paracraurococcus lichenis]|uniref:DUF4157 domain-containing protein n=1 Tax=Paracraurococcus lichenis TaxID=3064888 RepID=A0ABT9EAE7_9PROT|nr:DUF4157 domain-containing protein [Paracraurococcus sp. LOR1-02]MDO9712890.1 DUF4157 domain-containing protein [Paracraurococcus sp. LOR1-02]